jgi:CRP/FNR family transcriptional regulator, cyclic AMP receptor protein
MHDRSCIWRYLDETRASRMTYSHAGPNVVTEFGEYPPGLLAAGSPEQRCLLRLRNGQVIFGIGEEGHHVYMMISGRVKTTTVTPSGRSCLLDIYTPREFFGVSCFVTPTRFETATAMTPAVVCKISEDALLLTLSDTRSFIDWVRRLAKLLAERERRISHLATLDSEHRLAFVLLDLSAKMGVRVGRMTRVDCPITQQELADMVGTTRSRIGYFLQRFRARGLVGPKHQGCMVVLENAIRDYLGIPPQR